MQKTLSTLRARGAIILGHGAILKVLVISLSIAVIAFLVVAAMTYV